MCTTRCKLKWKNLRRREKCVTFGGRMFISTSRSPPKYHTLITYHHHNNTLMSINFFKILFSLVSVKSILSSPNSSTPFDLLTFITLSLSGNLKEQNILFWSLSVAGGRYWRLSISLSLSLSLSLSFEPF